MNADFTPDYENTNKLTPFKLFCYENFPFIEETFDSLTTYKMLQKIVKHLNEVINNVNIEDENVKNLYNAFIKLQDYVNNYFNSLDVQNEINNKLDEMVEDGTFDKIINNTLFNNINNEIDNLNQQLQNTNTNLSTTTNLANQNSSSIINLDNKINSIVGGNPKGTYPSLSDLQSAFPEGTTGIFVTSDTGHWYYYKTGSGWTDGGVYQSTGISEGSINPSKLNSILKNLIENSYIYPTTNTIKKLTFDNTSKSYFITFDNTNIMMLQQNDNNYTNIKVLGQTNFEIPNLNALVINKATLWNSPLNYTPELIDISSFNFDDLLNNYIILLYNNYGNLQGCMAYNFPFDNNKLSNKKVEIKNKVLTFYNKQINGEWIGTSISHLINQENNQDIINFTGSIVAIYDELRNIIEQQFQQLLIFTGEWTAVFKENSTVDFVGGGHGNEVLVDLELFIDGIKYDFDTDIPLMNYNNIQILAKSNVFSRINNELLCEKNILIDIADEIKIKSKIIWKQNTNIYFNYINMLPVSRHQYATDTNPFVTNAGFNDIDYSIKNYNNNQFPTEKIENVSYFELFNQGKGFQFRTSIEVKNDKLIEGNYGYVNPGSTNKIYFNYSPENYNVTENEVHSSTSIVKQYYSGLL